MVSGARQIRPQVGREHGGVCGGAERLTGQFGGCPEQNATLGTDRKAVDMYGVGRPACSDRGAVERWSLNEGPLGRFGNVVGGPCDDRQQGAAVGAYVGERNKNSGLYRSFAQRRARGMTARVDRSSPERGLARCR